MNISKLALASALAIALAAPVAIAQEPAQQSPSPAQPATPSNQPITQPQPPAESQAAGESTIDYKSWVGKTLETTDGSNIGEIAEVVAGPGNSPAELHADVGGFLGLGQTRVKLSPEMVTVKGDRLVVSMTEEQVKQLPKVES